MSLSARTAKQTRAHCISDVCGIDLRSPRIRRPSRAREASAQLKLRACSSGPHSVRSESAQMHVQCLQMTPGARALGPHGSWGTSLPFAPPRSYGSGCLYSRSRVGPICGAHGYGMTCEASGHVVVCVSPCFIDH